MIAFLAPVAVVASMVCAQPVERLTRAQVEEDLRVLGEAVRGKWSYYEMRVEKDGFDLAALIGATLTRRGEGATRAEFFEDLREIVGAMHDGHAHVVMPGVAGVEAGRRYQLFAVRDTDTGLMVSRVAPGLPERGPGVGARLLAVDGEPVSARIEREMRTVVGSTAGMRRAAAVEAALRTERDPCVVEFEDVEGKALRVSVPTSATPPAGLHVARSLALSWPAEGVALISLPSFAVLDWAAWLKTPVEERDAFLEKDKAALDGVFDSALENKPRAVILDLRGNGGGTDLLGIHAAQRLVGRPFRYFQLSAKYSGAWSPPHGQWHGPRKLTLEAPLFVLIDEGVFSTADNFARCIDEMRPDAVFIGRPTGAGTGAPAVIATLPHSGAVVSACTQRVYGPFGTLIEGVGTRPDIPVVWTREDAERGRDPDLAAALQRIGEKAPAGSP